MPFRIDPSRVTFRELRTEASIPAAALAWLLLKLRVPIPSSSDLPTVEELEPYRVHSATLDAGVREELDAEGPSLEGLGFKGTIYHRFVDTRHQTELHYASYLHKSGKAIARVTRRVFSANTPPKKNQSCAFITPLTQGRTLATSNGEGDLESPPACLDESVVGATVGETWKRHVERMKEPSIRESIEAVADGRGVLSTLQSRHEVMTNYLVERGVFVPVDDKAATGSASAVDVGALDSAAGGADPLLLAEVRKLEDKQPASWGTSLLVLIGTIALFLGFGGAVWSWQFTLLLIPILLVHEAGHYLAMKMFDYRNVRMFFIPLFGAAVTGRHYDVPGWKRVVTSLMGPVPGIVIGVGLGVVAMINQQDLLMEAAVLTLILNGFNLLPSLPLDGGWVLHGLLFSRHAFLDLLSRLLGIGLLFFLAFAGGAKLMMYLGIAMAIGVPASFKMARITDRLRASDNPLGPPKEGHAPTAAIGRIADEIDKAYPKGIDVRNKAQLTLTTYENVNARPPGIAATLTLGFVYVASFLTACVAGLVFALSQNSDLARLMADAALGPQVSVSSDSLATFPPGIELADVAWDEALIASFESAEAARTAFETLSSQPNEPKAAVLFGPSVMIDLPAEMSEAERDALFERFEAETPEVFLVGEDGGVSVQWSVITPTIAEAELIADEISRHTLIPAELQPYPPWSRSYELSPTERTARETVKLLTSGEWMAQVDTPDEWWERLDTAQRRGRKQVVEQMYRQERAKYDEALANHLRSLRDRDSSEVDQAIVEAYERALEKLANKPADVEDEADHVIDYVPPMPESKDWLPAVADRLGCADPEGSPLVDANHGYGYAMANGPTISITLDFRGAPAGPVRVLQWLESQGCTDIKCRLSKSWFEGILD